jgi:signal transduction histidine kinase
VVRQIAELHGGRARLTSAGQEGPIVFALDIAVANPCPGAMPSPA